MLGLGAIPSIVMCFCLLFLFETPRWLVFHGKVDKAREVMRKIRSDDMVEEELSDIVNDYELTSKNTLGKKRSLYYLRWDLLAANLIAYFKFFFYITNMNVSFQDQLFTSSQLIWYNTAVAS